MSERGRAVRTGPDRPTPSDRNGTVNGKHGPAWRAVEADDWALDALPAIAPGSDDPAFRLLAAWRDDLDADLPAPPPPHVPPPRSRYKRRGRRRRMGLAAGLAVLATSGLMSVAVFSASAEPGNPLFQVTKVIYPDTAAYRERVATAQRDIYHARRAAAAGREDDARRYLDDADRHSRDIHGDDASRVRRQADQVRRNLDHGKHGAHPPVHSGTHGWSAAPSPSPSAPGPSPSSSASPSSAPSPSGQNSTEASPNPHANPNSTKDPSNSDNGNGNGNRDNGH